MKVADLKRLRRLAAIMHAAPAAGTLEWCARQIAQVIAENPATGGVVPPNAPPIAMISDDCWVPEIARPEKKVDAALKTDRPLETGQPSAAPPPPTTVAKPAAAVSIGESSDAPQDGTGDRARSHKAVRRSTDDASRISPIRIARTAAELTAPVLDRPGCTPERAPSGAATASSDDPAATAAYTPRGNRHSSDATGESVAARTTNKDRAPFPAPNGMSHVKQSTGSRLRSPPIERQSHPLFQDDPRAVAECERDRYRPIFR